MTHRLMAVGRLQHIPLSLLLGAVAAAAPHPATADVYSCICDLDPENPTFSLRADRGDYLLELSEHDDFSFARVFNVSVPASGSCDTRLDGSDFMPASYFWRYRQCGYSTARAFYPDYGEQATVTFGSKESLYIPVVEKTQYSDVSMPDGSTYVIEPVWVRSHITGNHWIGGSPRVWVSNDPTAEETSEWPVHGTIIRDNVIFTPIGGGKFNSAWISDGKGLGLNRMRLSDGAPMPPLRITAPEERPFRTPDDGDFAAAMYQIAEDNDGTVYFTTTTDLVYNNMKKPVDIRIYAIDLSAPEAIADKSATITARFIEQLKFPTGASNHARNHQVKIQGSLNGRHTAWVATSNTGGDAVSTPPVTTIYRWKFDSPEADPTVEKSTISNLHIGGYNPKSDYITVISHRIIPMDDAGLFIYHATYFDNGLDPVVYYDTAPTLCRFVAGGQCEIISDLRDSDGCNTAGVTPQAVGVSLIDVQGNTLMAFGSVNGEGASTITLATAPDAPSRSFSGAKPLAVLNPGGFSTRLRQSVDVRYIPGHLLAHAGNGGIALYSFHSTTTTGLVTTEDQQPDVTVSDGRIRFSSPVTDVRIHDISGRTVLTSPAAATTLHIALDNGLYILTAEELNTPIRIAIKN